MADKYRTMRIVVAVSVFGAEGWEPDSLRDWVLNSEQVMSLFAPDPDRLIDVGAGVKITAIITDAEVTS